MLVNASSFRLIIGFALSFNVTTWVEELGLFKCFGIYSAALGIATLGLPLVYVYGKRMRAWTGGRLEASVVTEVHIIRDDKTGAAPSP